MCLEQLQLHLSDQQFYNFIAYYSAADITGLMVHNIYDS